MRIWVFSALSLVVGIVASGLLLTLTVLNSPYGVSSLQYSDIAFRKEETQNEKELLRASFVVAHDYLGILFVPFTKTKPLPQVPLTLKLYDKRTGICIHEHTYVAKNFSDKPYFPVGMPVIKHSGGKTVVLTVTINDADTRMKEDLTDLAFDFNTKASTVHLVDRRELRRDNFMAFLANKTVTSIALIGWWPFAGILFLSVAFPIVIMLLGRLGLLGVKILSLKPIWIFLLGLLTLVLVLMPYALSDSLSAFWLVGYFIFVLKTKLTIRSHFAWALGFLLLCPIFLTFGDEAHAEKSAIFVFFFMCFGVGHELLEMFRNPTKYNSDDDMA